MYSVPGRCPICSSDLVVTQLQCHSCGTELVGSFTLGRIFGLNSEQMHFVEILIRHRGNVSKVGDELGLSYSTARTKLDEVIRALGYEVVEEESGAIPERRREILEGVAAGELSVEEAARQLRRV